MSRIGSSATNACWRQPRFASMRLVRRDPRLRRCVIPSWTMFSGLPATHSNPTTSRLLWSSATGDEHVLAILDHSQRYWYQDSALRVWSSLRMWAGFRAGGCLLVGRLDRLAIRCGSWLGLRLLIPRLSPCRRRWVCREIWPVHRGPVPPSRGLR